MTHTLHRYVDQEDSTKDFIVFSMAAQGFNEKHAGPKLADNLQLMVKAGPVNYGDDNRGGVLTGVTLEEMIELATDQAYMAAVFDNTDNLKDALRSLKEADNGMSIVVTGNLKEAFKVLSEVGIKPHTVNISLGVHGKKEMLPEKNILKIITMCGHGMVCSDHVKAVMKKVRKGRMTPREASIEIARPCTCAMFNPIKAAEIITKSCCKE